jgi:hypothetical protein
MEKGARRLKETDYLVDALTPVVAAFRQLGIRHYVGGSVASSFHGATRTTMDVDLVCELEEKHVQAFVGSFSDDYYISEPAIRDAVRRSSCFNLIYLPTSWKVDVFISRRRPFDQDAMQRASLQLLGGVHRIDVHVATADDSIISKLEWYRLSNETSNRQWDDVSRLITLLGETADLTYLENAATSVGVRDLLTRLLDQ